MQFGRVAACNSLYELYPPLVEVHGCDGLLDECSGVLRWKLSSPIAGGTRSLLARAVNHRASVFCDLQSSGSVAVQCAQKVIANDPISSSCLLIGCVLVLNLATRLLTAASTNENHL